MPQATVRLRTGEGLRRGHILMGGWVDGIQVARRKGGPAGAQAEVRR